MKRSASRGSPRSRAGNKLAKVDTSKTGQSCEEASEDKQLIQQDLLPSEAVQAKTKCTAEEQPEKAEERPEIAEERPGKAEERPEIAEERPGEAEERPEIAEERPVDGEQQVPATLTGTSGLPVDAQNKIQRTEDFMKTIASDWTVEQLKALHEFINKRGTEENALSYGATRIPGRSPNEILQMVESIREAINNERSSRVLAQKTAWISSTATPLQDTSSEITSWSQAVHAIQTRKRQINDCTKQALIRFMWHEIGCRPASQTTRRLLPVTDSKNHPGSSVTEVVDFCRLYRFLHSCLLGGPVKELKSLEASILLNILNDIQEEVDSDVHEPQRRILAGIFRSIQENKLSEYDFHSRPGWDSIRSVQIDPLNLLERTPSIFFDDPNSASSNSSSKK